MSLKKKHEEASKDLAKQRRLAKLTAIGLTITTTLAGFGIGVSIHNNGNIKDLEEQVKRAESRLEEVQKEVESAKAADEQNYIDIMALQDRCQKLQETVAKYEGMSKELADHAQDLAKTKTILDAVQKGAFSGQELVNAVSDIQIELSNQTRAILAITDKLKENTNNKGEQEEQKPEQTPEQTPEQKPEQNPEQSPENEIKYGSVLDGVTQVQNRDEAAQKLIININKLTLDVVSGVRTDYEVVFADLENAESSLERLGFSEEQARDIYKEIIEAQVAVAKKDYSNSLSGAMNAKYTKYQQTVSTTEGASGGEAGVAKDEKGIYNTYINEQGDKQYSLINDKSTQIGAVIEGKVSYDKVDVVRYEEVLDNLSQFAGEGIEGIAEQYKEGEITKIDIKRSNSGYSIDYQSEVDASYDLILGEGIDASIKEVATDENGNGFYANSQNLSVRISAMTKEEYNAKAGQVTNAIEQAKKLAEQQKAEENENIQPQSHQ